MGNGQIVIRKAHLSLRLSWDNKQKDALLKQQIFVLQKPAEL